MKKKILLMIFLTILLVSTLTLVKADAETFISCGGDGETYIGCNPGDSQTGVFFGRDSVAPNITIFYPEDSTTYAENESIALNFSIFDPSPLDKCWFKVVDDDGNIEINNQSISSCVNTTFDLPDSDFFTLTMWANDTFSNEGSSQISFTLSLIAPATNLQTPSNNEWFNNEKNIYFNFTTTDFDGIEKCELYSNFTGIWKLNETFNFVTSGIQKSTQKNLSENSFIWNVNCEDQLGVSSFAESNYTVNVDLTNPNSTIKTENDVQIAGKEFTLKYNITDDRILNSCYFTLYDADDNGIHNYNANTTLNCSGLTRDLTTLDYGDFYINVWGEDNAGNLDMDTINLTTLNIIGETTGGGGAPVVIGAAESEWTMETTSGSSIYQLKRLPGDRVVLPIILENTGTLKQDIFLECANINGSMCNFVSFERNNIELLPLQDTKVRVEFIIQIPDDAKGEYLFNLEGIDNFGRKGAISVQLDTDLGFINSIYTKLFFSSSNILYMFLFLILSIFLGYVFDKGVSQKVIKNKSFASFTSVIFGVGVALIVIGLPII